MFQERVYNDECIVAHGSLQGHEHPWDRIAKLDRVSVDRSVGSLLRDG